jgi:catechol 2,3-dioxygenase-like lactoylglutathione lyase family enzyme
VDVCLAFARQAGYRRVVLWTNDVLESARRIYQAAGFTVTDESPHHSFGHDLVGQTWVLTLEEHAAEGSPPLPVRRSGPPAHPRPAGGRIDVVALIVDEYDPAIAFFTGVLGFELVEDSPALTTDGRPKRWVVVRPPGAQTGLLLARAEGERQRAAVGDQAAGRVGFFLRVDDFEAAYRRMTAAGVTVVREPRTEPYGRVAVFLDVAGNRWDLLGP